MAATLQERILAWTLKLPKEVHLIEVRDGSDGEPPLALVLTNNEDRTTCANEIADVLENARDARDSKLTVRLLACAPGKDLALVKLTVTVHMPMPKTNGEIVQNLRSVPGTGDASLTDTTVAMYADHTFRALQSWSDSLGSMLQRLDEFGKRQDKLVERIFTRFDAVDAERAAETERRRAAESMLEEQTDLIEDQNATIEKASEEGKRAPMIEQLANRAYEDIKKHALKILPGGSAGDKPAEGLAGAVADAARAVAEESTKGTG